jgi:C4-dicarboxylate-specific signal transduction histidine kinase
VRRGDGVVHLPLGVVEKWQTIVDTMAELVNVPAGLIMRLDGDKIEVGLSSRSVGNPYHVGEADVWEGSGLYCETAITSGRRLIVPDALADPRWRTNPDVPRGMIAYLGFPIRWPDHEPFGTICVLDNKANAYNSVHERLVEQFRDVIEHHLQLISMDSERQQAAVADHARQALALRCSEQRLRDAQTELARVSRLSAIGQFAGSVVHEMNQPLAAMTASAEACVRWLDRDAPDVPAARAAVQRLFDASRRASDVMAGLRSLARKAPLAPADLDLHEVIREVMMIAHDETDHARVEQRLALDPAARYVRGDRVQLQLVLHNLIRNAVDAMAGRIDHARTLTVSTVRSGSDEIEVWVDDTGTGLAPDLAARLFESSVTTKAQGMGMGLMICRSVIEAHDGRIAVKAREDAPGARFVFTLPARAS